MEPSRYYGWFSTGHLPCRAKQTVLCWPHNTSHSGGGGTDGVTVRPFDSFIACDARKHSEDKASLNASRLVRCVRRWWRGMAQLLPVEKPPWRHQRRAGLARHGPTPGHGSVVQWGGKKEKVEFYRHCPTPLSNSNRGTGILLKASVSDGSRHVGRGWQSGGEAIVKRPLGAMHLKEQQQRGHASRIPTGPTRRERRKTQAAKKLKRPYSGNGEDRAKQLGGWDR